MLRNELSIEDPESFKNYLRMDDVIFKELLSSIEDTIKKQNTQFRQSISAEKRLAITLRYLASGNTYRDLMFATRIHESTISLIVPEVCEAIVKTLMPEYIKMPATVSEWKKVTKGFETLWNFPMCIGSLDGKHVEFQAPRSVGSYYYNYKGAHSIVLLALVDAYYKFLYVDVGINGRISDGGVFCESSLQNAIDTNRLNLPNDECLPGTTVKVPYVIVGDDAFPLSKRLMKPFPQRGLSKDKRIFNYRLLRARRVVENAFGILSNRFRIMRSTINLSPEKAEIITLTCCVLHNFLATKNKNYIGSEIPECNLPSVSRQGGSHCSNAASDVRLTFCEYFNSPLGSVVWQNKAIGIL